MRDQEDKALNHGGSADAADANANGQATNEAKSNENKGGDAEKIIKRRSINEKSWGKKFK